MIATFSVENFLSIRERLSLSFEPTRDVNLLEDYSYEVKKDVRLLKLGIIYGSNASGKSNLLQAFSYLCSLLTEAPQQKTKELGIIPFLLDEDSRHQTTKFELSFYIEGTRHFLQLELNNSFILRERLVFYPSTQPALLYERCYNEEKELVEIQWGTRLGLSKRSQSIVEGNTLANSSLLGAWSKSNTEMSHLNTLYEYFDSRMMPPILSNLSLVNLAKDELKGSEEARQFIQRFLTASDFNISNIELKEEHIPIDEKVLSGIIAALPISEQEKQDILAEGGVKNQRLIFSHKTSKGVYKLDQDFESGGTLQMLGLAALLYNLLSKHRFVLIDEVEQSLHYELLSYFIRAFLASSEGTSQILLTTHDLNLLDEDFIRRDAVWFTDKDEEGVTTLKRLTDFGLHKHSSVYNAYRQNKLVSLPFLGSQYLSVK